jgi:hypothetical protein
MHAVRGERGVNLTREVPLPDWPSPPAPGARQAPSCDPRLATGLATRAWAWAWAWQQPATSRTGWLGSSPQAGRSIATSNSQFPPHCVHCWWLQKKHGPFYRYYRKPSPPAPAPPSTARQRRCYWDIYLRHSNAKTPASGTAAAASWWGSTAGPQRAVGTAVWYAVWASPGPKHSPLPSALGRPTTNHDHATTTTTTPTSAGGWRVVGLGLGWGLGGLRLRATPGLLEGAACRAARSR